MQTPPWRRSLLATSLEKKDRDMVGRYGSQAIKWAQPPHTFLQAFSLSLITLSLPLCPSVPSHCRYSHSASLHDASYKLRSLLPSPPSSLPPSEIGFVPRQWRRINMTHPSASLRIRPLSMGNTGGALSLAVKPCIIVWLSSSAVPQNTQKLF
jgi:hypothetical protein